MSENIKYGCGAGETAVVDNAHDMIASQIDAELMNNPDSEVVLSLNKLRNNLASNKKKVIEDSCEADVFYKDLFENKVQTDGRGMRYVKEDFIEGLVKEIKDKYGFAYSKEGYPGIPKLNKKQYDEMVKEASLYVDSSDLRYRYSESTGNIYIEDIAYIRNMIKGTITHVENTFDPHFLYLYGSEVLWFLYENPGGVISGRSMDDFILEEGVLKIPGILEHLNSKPDRSTGQNGLGLGEQHGVIFEPSGEKITVRKDTSVTDLDCYGIAKNPLFKDDIKYCFTDKAE